MVKRVVVTGAAALTSIGDNWQDFSRALKSGKSGVQYIDAWDKYTELNTRLGGPVDNFKLPDHYTRKRTRSMGRVSLFATRVSELALEDAGLLEDPYFAKW